MDEAYLPKLKSLTGYTCSNVVEYNKFSFTTRDLEAVDTARSLFKALGMPSYSWFIHAIKNNLIKNCTITIADVI